MKTKTQKKLTRVNIKKPWAGPNSRGVSPRGVPDVYGGYDLRKRKVLRLEWKNDGVMEE